MRDEDRDRDFWQRKAPQYDRVAKGLFGRPLTRVLELTANGVAGGDTVLEVPAGTGLITAVIAPRVRRVVATDYADTMLAILRERMTTAGISNVESARRNIYDLGYPAASFDIVVAGNVLHLVPDLERALDALRQVLRPGGKLIAPTFVHDETRLSRVVSRLLVTVLGQPISRRLIAAGPRAARIPRDAGGNHPRFDTGCLRREYCHRPVTGARGRLLHDFRRTGVGDVVRAGNPARVAMQMTGTRPGACSSDTIS